MSFIYTPATSTVGQSNLTTGTALTAGQSVAVNSSGQAVAVSGNAQGAGAQALVTNSGDTTTTTWGDCSAYDTVNQRLVVFYQKPTTGDYYCKVGTLTSGTWTFGTEVLVIANTGGTTVNNGGSAIYNAAAGKIIFMGFWNNTSISLIAGTVSGTTITFGSITTYNTITIYNAGNITYDDTTGQALIGFYHSGAGNGSYAAVLSLSGTTITVNTAVIISSIRYYSSFVAGNGYILGFAFKSLTGLVAVAAQISGTTLVSPLDEVVVGSLGNAYASVYASTTKTYHVVNVQNTGSPNVYIDTIKYTTAGGFTSAEITALTSGSFDATYTGSAALAYDTSTSYLIFTWTPTGTTTAMQTYLYTISGLAITFYASFAAQQSTTKAAYFQTISFNDGTFSYSYRVTTTGYTYVNQVYEITNTNYTGFIGFSSGSYGIGTTATILTDGAITVSQSGLTPGLKYYIQPNGTLTTTASTNQYAGHALTATSLLILG